jgi:hypothetical protein
VPRSSIFTPEEPNGDSLFDINDGDVPLAGVEMDSPSTDDATFMLSTPQSLPSSPRLLLDTTIATPNLLSNTPSSNKTPKGIFDFDDEDEHPGSPDEEESVKAPPGN